MHTYSAANLDIFQKQRAAFAVHLDKGVPSIMMIAVSKRAKYDTSSEFSLFVLNKLDFIVQDGFFLNIKGEVVKGTCELSDAQLAGARRWLKEHILELIAYWAGQTPTNDLVKTIYTYKRIES
jgi:hypothetical protein